MRKVFGFSFLVVALSVALVACGSTKQATKQETGSPVKATKAVPAQPAGKPGASATAAKQEAPQVVLKDVHFDFDRYVIRPADAQVLKQDFGWFKAHPGKRARIEGYCDERGTAEYNLALGQKRADATKDFLVKLGVPSKDIETISYGKEKPLDPGHDEQAWAKNRRAHIESVK